MLHETMRFRLEWWVTAYRRERGAWPGTVQDLEEFGRLHGWALEWAPFHTLRFDTESAKRMRIDYVLSPDAEGWAESGAIILMAREESDALAWRSVWTWGPKRQVLVLSFCERHERYRVAV